MLSPHAQVVYLDDFRPWASHSLTTQHDTRGAPCVADSRSTQGTAPGMRKTTVPTSERMLSHPDPWESRIALVPHCISQSVPDDYPDEFSSTFIPTEHPKQSPSSSPLPGRFLINTSSAAPSDLLLQRFPPYLIHNSHGSDNGSLELCIPHGVFIRPSSTSHESSGSGLPLHWYARVCG